MGWQDAPLATDSAWAQAPVDNPAPVYSGSILPFSKYADGSVGFDSNAGIVGTVKRALDWPTLTHQAQAEMGDARGSISTDTPMGLTPETAGQAFGTAALFAPGDLIVPGVSGTMARGYVPVPTTGELYGAADAAYGAARNLGVDYGVPHVGDMSGNVQQSLYGMGLTPSDAPKTFGKLSALQSPPPGASAVPFSGLESARRGFTILGKDADPVERMASGKAKTAIDDFVDAPPDGAVLAGDSAAASRLTQDARGNYAAGKRSDLVENKGDYAELFADSAHSGTNFDNAARQRIRPLLDPAHPERLAGFSGEERAALEDFVRGTPSRNAARIVGNLLGGGLGMHGAGMGIAGALAGLEAGGIPGAIIGAGTPLLGTAIKGAQNRMAANAIDKLTEALRTRSPLYQQREAATPFEVQPYGKSAALTRALLARQGYASPDQRQ